MFLIDHNTCYNIILSFNNLTMTRIKTIQLYFSISTNIILARFSFPAPLTSFSFLNVLDLENTFMIINKEQVLSSWRGISPLFYLK